MSPSPFLPLPFPPPRAPERGRVGVGALPTRSSNELCTGVRPTLEDETGPRLFRPTQARGSRLMTGQFLYRRRELMLLLGGVTTAAGALRAQQKAMPVIGFLGSASPGPFAPLVAAFRRGLGETGYVEGQNLAIEYRWAEGLYDRLPALAAELVGRKVDLIAATGGPLPALAANTRPRRSRSSLTSAATRSSSASSLASAGQAATSRASASCQPS